MDQLADHIVEDDDDDEDIRDRPFNAYRKAASETTKSIVNDAVALLLQRRAQDGVKRNKPRARDQLVFEQTVEAVLCDLIHHHLIEYDGHIYVTRSNRILGVKSRYRPAAYSKMFPSILDLLDQPEVALVMQEKAKAVEGAARATTIRPGKRLLEQMEKQDVGLDDIDEEFTGETIILKRQKDRANYWDEGGMLEYEDDAVIDRYRHQLREINDWIRSADLRFDHSGIPWPHTIFDLADRRLRRVFTQGRFNSGGRLFGGFWQNLRKHERRRGLFIGPEKAVELDYGQAGPRILYGMAGLQPPSGDLYGFPGYFAQRNGIKRVMSAMIFAGERLDRFPKGTKGKFRKSDKIGDVVEAIEHRHQLLKDHFHRGLGHDAQFIESEIMIEVLLTLKGEGVVALPIHDAVMVPSSAERLAKEIMLSVFLKKAGTEGVVTREE